MDNDNKPTKFCYPYPHAAITADCIVFGYDPNKTLRVLLVKRRNEPYKDCWAFPGGFMEIDEDLKTCARREVMEETGMALGEVFQFRSYSAVDRDPRERVITVVHSPLRPSPRSRAATMPQRHSGLTLATCQSSPSTTGPSSTSSLSSWRM